MRKEETIRFLLNLYINKLEQKNLNYPNFPHRIITVLTTEVNNDGENALKVETKESRAAHQLGLEFDKDFICYLHSRFFEKWLLQYLSEYFRPFLSSKVDDPKKNEFRSVCSDNGEISNKGSFRLVQDCAIHIPASARVCT